MKKEIRTRRQPFIFFKRKGLGYFIMGLGIIHFLLGYNFSLRYFDVNMISHVITDFISLEAAFAHHQLLAFSL